MTVLSYTAIKWMSEKMFTKGCTWCLARHSPQTCCIWGFFRQKTLVCRAQVLWSDNLGWDHHIALDFGQLAYSCTTLESTNTWVIAINKWNDVCLLPDSVQNKQNGNQLWDLHVVEKYTICTFLSKNSCLLFPVHGEFIISQYQDTGCGIQSVHSCGQGVSQDPFQTCQIGSVCLILKVPT